MHKWCIGKRVASRPGNAIAATAQTNLLYPPSIATQAITTIIWVAGVLIVQSISIEYATMHDETPRPGNVTMPSKRRICDNILGYGALFARLVDRIRPGGGMGARVRQRRRRELQRRYARESPEKSAVRHPLMGEIVSACPLCTRLLPAATVAQSSRLEARSIVLEAI